MKINSLQIKFYLSVLCLAICCYTNINAQENPVGNYLQQVGEYADIYNGKIETNYNILQYKNTPYYGNPDYTDASIIYRNIYYPNQKVRLDLFREQLIILSPEKRYGIVANSPDVEKILMYGKTFEWLIPPKESRLKQGFYIHLLEGKKLQLYSKDYYFLAQDLLTYRFDHKIQYYLLYNNRFYAVKNKGSFSKLFSQYKKQINQFANAHKLNFKNESSEDSFVSLAGYCDELMTSTNKQSYADIDSSFTVFAGANEIPPVELLKETLPGTPYNVSVYDNSLFILEGDTLDTDFPQALRYSPQRQDTTAGNRMPMERAGELSFANSENLVYAVGDPYLKNTPNEVILKGKVIDSKTKAPLPGISLVLKNPYMVATTDSSGNYSIKLPSGRIQLDISGFNIKASRRQLMLYDSGKLNFELIEEIHQLDEVSIIAQRTDNVKNIQLGTEKLQMSKIKNIPMAFGEADILRAIQSLPGVKTVGEASTGYNVRGGATDQNLILLNDGTIFNPSHLFGLFTAFSSDMVKDAALYKSSIPAQYGGRISSVLDITGKEANKEKFTGSAGIGLLTSKLTMEIPVIKNKSSILVSGRTTYSDWILKQLPKTSGYSDGTAGFYDLGVVFSHQIDAKDFLNVYGYYSHDRFDFNLSQRYAYTNGNTSVKWKRLFNDKFIGNFVVGYDHYDYMNIDSTNQATAFKLSFNINQLFAKADFTYDLDKHKLNFGFKTMQYNVNPGTYQPEGVNSLVRFNKLQNEKAFESALYMEDGWDITNKLSITGGIRFSIFNALGPRTYNTYNPDMLPYVTTIIDTLHVANGQIFKTYMGPEFRLSARYLLADNLSVKAGFNTMQQYIHKLSNTVIMSPTDTWKLSDANIRPQKGWQTATGLYYNANKNIWLASMEIYYKKMNDYLDYRSGAVLLMNPHIETDVINTNGYAYGVELSLKKEIGKLNGWVNYTYSRTFLRQSDKLIANPVNNGKWYPTDYDIPHDFKLTGNYKFTQRYSCSLNVDYSTGRPTTVPAGQYYNQTLNAMQVFYTERNTYRIPDYFRMDFSVNIEPVHKLNLLTYSSVSLGVYNLTGRSNAYSIYYISEKGQIKGYKLSIFGVPIPFITYNIKF